MSLCPLLSLCIRNILLTPKREQSAKDNKVYEGDMLGEDAKKDMSKELKRVRVAATLGHCIQGGKTSWKRKTC